MERRIKKKYKCGFHQKYPSSQLEICREKLEYTCIVLKFVFQGSALVLASKFCEEGGPELLNLLFTVHTLIPYCWKKLDGSKLNKFFWLV